MNLRDAVYRVCVQTVRSDCDSRDDRGGAEGDETTKEERRVLYRQLQSRGRDGSRDNESNPGRATLNERLTP